MADHPGPITMPSQQPLRSAMKHSSRPTTPSASSPPISPFFQPSPIPPVPTFPLASPVQSAVSTLNSSPSISTSPSASGTLPPALIIQSPASTTGGPNTAGYTSKVSFDTFENPVASMFSFTLQVKSDGYERAPSSRVFLCASSPDDSGRHALDWAIEGLVQDGDELIVFRGIDQDELGLSIHQFAYYQSDLASTERDHDVVRDEARDLMLRIQEQCVEADPDRKVSIRSLLTPVLRAIHIYLCRSYPSSSSTSQESPLRRSTVSLRSTARTPLLLVHGVHGR